MQDEFVFDSNVVTNSIGSTEIFINRLGTILMLICQNFCSQKFVWFTFLNILFPNLSNFFSVLRRVDTLAKLGIQRSLLRD